MFGWLKKLIKKKSVVSTTDDNASTTENNTLKCLSCKNDKWLEGPGGGSFGNIVCSNCGAKYNNMGPFGLHKIN